MKINAHDIPNHIQSIVNRLVNANHSAQLVGGAVRDLLLGQKPKDFDVCTSAHPHQVKKLFRRCYLIGKRFRLALVHTYDPRHNVTEVATYRDSSKLDNLDEESGRLLDDNAYGTIDTDALRRDFTINAIYYDIAKDCLIDKVGGLDDIANRLVRMIGSNTHKRICEDPLRAVRAVRFAEHNQIGIESGLADLLPDSRPLIDAIPRARVGLELSKIFSSPQALNILAGLNRYQLLDALVPKCVDDIFIPGKADAMHSLFSSIDARLQSAETTAINGAEQAPDQTIDGSATSESVEQTATEVTGLNESIAVFPDYLGEEIRYAAFYLPMFIECCKDGIDSFESVLLAIDRINPQLLCPTLRSHRRGMLALWRSLPRIFLLRPAQMRRFSLNQNFPATWFLYRQAVQAGVWQHDSTTEAWDDFMGEQHGRAYLNRIRDRNQRGFSGNADGDGDASRHNSRRGNKTGGQSSRNRRRRGGRRRGGAARRAAAE